MFKYLIAVLAAIFAALIFIYFFVGVPTVWKESLPVLKTPHFYQKPEMPIAEIKISAFYFAPKNKIGFVGIDWYEKIQSALEKIANFHNLQFQAASKISYEIYPEVVIGLKDNLSYDSESTQNGNPEGLKNIKVELFERVLSPEGDLYKPYFGKARNNVYNVFLIVYEGVGASASENTILLSQTFLADSTYQYYGQSILAHEFYHTLGLPDGYELPSSINFFDDIMGLGRYRPLERTYLNPFNLAGMGI